MILIDLGVQATVTCSSIANCATCLTPNFCSSCVSGFTINSQGNACLTNNCQVTNCLSCLSETVCQTCQNGYILLSNNCIQCQLTGCQTCSATNVCSQCYTGYTLNATSSTCSYTGCLYPCGTCDSNGKCLTCLTPFSQTPYDNGTCFTCSIANCVQCSSNSLNTCTQCNTGYIPNSSNTTCTWACSSPKCTACANGPNSCTSCVSGYVANGGVCSQCNNAPICTSCQPGNLSACLKCATGYYTNTSSNTCQVCPGTNCAACGLSNTATNTLICTQFNGYLPYQPTTQTSQVYYPYVCDQGCQQCASNYPASCLQCSLGFYLVISSTTNVGQCMPCGQNCATCSFNTNNQIICQSCYSNAFLVNNACLVCSTINNCQTCLSSNLNSCVSCPIGYYLTYVPAVTTTPAYYTCIMSCPQNCLTCFNAANTNQSGYNPNNIACSSCNTGYSLSITGACLPCITNCRVCSGQYQSICLECGQGYYLATLTSCVACPVGCQ